MQKHLRPGIYAILDLGSLEELLALGQSLLERELCALQIRAKSLRDEDRKTLARRLWNIHQKMNAPYPLIVNDDLSLAQELGCGLHLGQDDLPVAKARQILGREAWIGLSTHDLSQVRQEAARNADYLGYGPIYPTTSKRGASEPRGLGDLPLIRQVTDQPLVAIGGLTFQNLRPLLDQGIRHFAMLSAVHTPRFDEELRRFLAMLRDLS